MPKKKQKVQILEEKKELPFKNPNYKHKRYGFKKSGLKQLLQQESWQPVNYLSIDAPPSTKPLKKYCDLCGQLSKYILQRSVSNESS